MDVIRIRLCACGCNQEVKTTKDYIYGHKKNPMMTLFQQYCLCGCGLLAKPNRKYIYGHYFPPKEHIQKIGFKKGCEFTDEHIKRLSESHLGNKGYWKGKKISEGHRRKLSIAKKGVKRSEKTKRKISKTSKGHKGYWKGKKLSLETREKMSKTKQENGVWNKGMKNPYTEEMLRRMSEAQKGEKSYCWKGGISKEPYSFDFNIELKCYVIKRDNYICQNCGKTEQETGESLCVHHIDYDKNNSDFSNLISLCRSCHSKTNYNRELWTQKFAGMIILRGRSFPFDS